MSHNPASVMHFDPAERAREKQASRDADERALSAGLISSEQMQRKNGFVSPEMIAASQFELGDSNW